MCKDKKEVQTAESQQGDDAHAFAAHILKGKRTPESYRNTSIITVKEEYERHEIKISDDMINTVTPYVQRCRQLMIEHPKAWHGIETTLSMGWIHPKMFGTPDFCMLIPKVKGYVWDLKAGRGEYVEEKNNDQLMAYGAGILGPTLHDHKITIELGVSQPNSYVDAPANRSVVVTANQVYEWVTDIRKVIAAAEAPDAPCIPGKVQCQFCIAFPCPACNQVVASFTDGSKTVKVTEMSGKDLARAMDLRPVLRKFIKDVEKETRRRHDEKHPDPAPGYELAYGKRSYEWNKEEKEIVSSLELFLPEEEIYHPSKLKTVAQIRAAFKAAQIDSEIISDLIKTHRGLTMKPISDKNVKPLQPVEKMF
jgi:transposase-like protein